MLRPQPLGVLPLPAGALLLPDVPGAAAVAADLVRGIVPSTWPEGLAFVADVLAGRETEVPGDDDVARINRFVLAPSPEHHAALRPTLAPELGTLLDALAFTAGVSDTATSNTATTDTNTAPGLQGELLAFVLLAVASDHLEHGSPADARDSLLSGVAAAREASPALAAQLLGTLAGFEGEDAVARTTEALALLPTGHQTQVRAELLFGRGVALQSSAEGRPGLLKEAVRCYQQALVVFRRESHPQEFAEAQTNLALCHLATPMAETGDHLRLGIAVQALRDALSVWDRENHPAQWASVTLNLANALQHRPSAYQADNLVEAVELYEELLALRGATHDPAGRARVLANQGTALAHLGIGEHAREKLLAAQELFTLVGEPGSALALETTLAELDAVRLVRSQGAIA